MATKKYLTLDGLTQYDGLIKAEISEGDEAVKSYVDGELAKKANATHSHDDLYYTEAEIDQKFEGVNSSIEDITSGETVVKKAEHATSADSATSAASAADAEKLGGQLPSYYAKASDIPTGALASKDEVSESDLDEALAAKVNAASEGNHSHSNKTVLDGITSDKVSAWDSALDEAKAYTNTKTTDMATTGVVDSKISTHNSSADAHSDIRATLKEVKDDVDFFFKDALKDEADTQKYKDTLREIQEYIATDATAAETLANKADKDHEHTLADVTDVTATAAELNFMSGVTSNVQEQLDAKDAAIEAVKVEASNQDAVVLLEAQQSATTYTDTVFGDHTKSHAPANAQANVIESIKVNGTAQTVTSKAVDIIVPTKASDIGAAESGHGHDVATESANGFMSAEMVTKLKGIAEGATAVTVDSALSETSTNPVQNKVVYGAVGTLTSAVSANTSSITAHSTAITNLQTAVSEIQEITSQEIADLFK